MTLFPRIDLGCVVIVALLVLVGCERSAEPQDSQVDTSVSGSEAPVITGNEALPAGHPPIDAPPPISVTDTMPSDHPSIEDENALSDDGGEFGHPELSGSEIEIIVPDEAHEKWVAILLGVTDGDDASEIRAEPGVPIRLEQSGYTLLVEAFMPSYSSDFNTITSVSNELDNPAAMVQLKKGGEVVARGWVFQNLPEYNTFKHESVKVLLQSAESAESKMHHGEQH